MILACLSYPRSDMTLSVQLREQGGPPVREFDTIVEEVHRHGPSIVEIVVRAEAPVDYRAAQYFAWVLPGVAPDRSFSVANRPGSTRLEFHVRIYPHGKVGQFFAHNALEPGAVLTLRGPFGSVELTDDEYRPAILVAGGTGLAPIKAVLDAAFAAGSRRPIHFFYGTRRAADLYHLDTMARWARLHPNFTFIPVLSDEPAQSTWAGERGLVTEALARNVKDAFGAVAFMCGPPPMIDAAIPLLRKLGIDRDDIHYDKFTPVALPANA
jgi:NAD(P)H-flavin reductase